MTKEPVNFYIDGYNLYRGIKESPTLYPYYLWLNLSELCTNLVDKKDEVVKTIRYFTAFPLRDTPEKGERRLRHETFVNAARAFDCRVEPSLGEMKKVTRQCEAINGCGLQFEKTVEKQTDVALGSTMVADIYSGQCRHVYVITGDSDVVPALRLVRLYKEHYVRIRFWFPPNRDGHTDEIKSNCDSWNTLDETTIMLRQLPLDVNTPSGGILSKPFRWRTPPRANT